MTRLFDAVAGRCGGHCRSGSASMPMRATSPLLHPGAPSPSLESFFPERRSGTMSAQPWRPSPWRWRSRRWPGVALGLVLGMRRFAGGTNPELALHYSQSEVVSGGAANLRPRHVGQGGVRCDPRHDPGDAVHHGGGQEHPAGAAAHGPVLRLSPTQTALRVLAPAVAPEIITGLRVGFALTLLGVLIGEMFASQRGQRFPHHQRYQRPRRAHDDGRDADCRCLCGRR